MVSFSLNGTDVSVDAPDGISLLSVLSENLGINGVKYGCGKSQCGSCSILLDGVLAFSCQTRADSVAGRSVTTLEGLRDGDEPSALQKAFIEEQAAQCGYCLSGMITAAQALLDINPTPTEADVRAALNGNLCRCGSHNRIIRAVIRAAEEA